MPVMDGIETLRHIRKKYLRLPVVMFSSLTERGAKATLEALVAGANDYVAKPTATDKDSIVAKIESELVPKLRAVYRPPDKTKDAGNSTASKKLTTPSSRNKNSQKYLGNCYRRIDWRSECSCRYSSTSNCRKSSTYCSCAAYAKGIHRASCRPTIQNV